MTNSTETGNAGTAGTPAPAAAQLDRGPQEAVGNIRTPPNAAPGFSLTDQGNADRRRGERGASNAISHALTPHGAPRAVPRCVSLRYSGVCGVG